jgi:Ca-activated chloride channel family protein
MRWLLALLLLVPAPAVSAQETPAASAQETAEPTQDRSRATFTSGVEAVTVSIAVRSRRGRVVADLTRADFTVLDSGEPVEIDTFYAAEGPISLAILLDISGSMAVGGNMDRAREAVAVTARNLQNEIDEAALFTFDSQLREVVSFTHDLAHVHSVSLEGRPWGKTSLYDAIAQTATAVSRRSNQHRALLVITDGEDTGSELTPAQVSGIASSIDVPVYLLTVSTPIDHTGGALEAHGEARARTTATLLQLAQWTGGDMRLASTPAHLVTGVREVLAELRHRYVISFEPGTRPGWHPIEIRTRKGDLVVRARGGYVSGPARDGAS